MNGVITRTWAAGGLTGVLLALAGCCPHYQDVVDPCYPQRYQHMARKETEAAFAPQVQNGHVLEQTVWNAHFEPGSARLTPAGMERLVYITRKRPCPDANVYVQSTHDVPYDPANPDRYSEGRNNLDAERVAAVQKFLVAETAGRGLVFNVMVHNPPDVGQAGIRANNSIRTLYLTTPIPATINAPNGSVTVPPTTGTSGSF